jgi:hypothetical protein
MFIVMCVPEAVCSNQLTNIRVTCCEKESLTKMLSDCKQQLENAKAMEKREEKVRQSRDDASTIQQCNTEVKCS